MNLINKIIYISAIFCPLIGETFADAGERPEKATLPKPTNGYKIINTDDFSLTIGGRIQVQGFYDVNGHQPGSPYGLEDTNIPLRKTPTLDLNAYKKGNFNYALNGSRFSIDAHKKFYGIDYHGYLELDFNGNSSTTTNSYTARIRHGYFEACGWLIGQTWFTFADRNAFITTVENLYTSSRQSMIRFTHHFTPEVTLAIAADRPNTQSYQIAVSNAAGTTTVSGNTGFFDNDSSAAGLKSQFPDGALNLKYKSKWGHVALRGVVRDLQARTKIGSHSGTVVENYKASKLGWGIGISTRFNIINCVSILAQGNYGKGIGRYIDDLANNNPYDSIFVYPTTASAKAVFKTALKPVKAWNLIGGFELHFTDKLWSNFAYSCTKMSIPKIAKSIFVNSTNQLHRKLQRYVGNVLYDVLPNTQIGLEIIYYTRKAGTTASYNGKDTRILAGLTYNI